jgi:hypothetical protein
MLKWHSVTVHHVISVYNVMFNHMDGMMRALAKKKTQCKEDMLFAVKLAQQKLTQCYAEVTPMGGMVLISAHIFDAFWKLQSFRMWDKGMDINPEEKTSNTTQYQEAFLMYVENGYYAKHRWVPGNTLEDIPSSNLVPSATPSASCQLSFDPYDLSSDDEVYLTPQNVAEKTPRQSDRTTHFVTSAGLYLNLLPAAPKKWGQNNPTLNNYHSHPMEISSTLRIPDITNW